MGFFVPAKWAHQRSHGYGHGQVPNRDQQVERAAVMKLVTKPAPAFNVERLFDRPVMSPGAAVEDLGLSKADESSWAKFLGDVVKSASYEPVLRQQVMERLLQEDWDPSLRKVVLRRSVQLYRDMRKSIVTVDELKAMQKAGPYVGPKGGKWADPQHTIPWKEGKKDLQTKLKKPSAKFKAVKMSPTVVSVFETDVHELAADPEGHGLDAEEARAYRLLNSLHDRKTDRFRFPGSKAEAKAVWSLLTDLSNSADDRAEEGPKEERALNKRVASTLATLGSKILSHAESLEKAKGEGSRGGKVIGHTTSGRPIYAGNYNEGPSASKILAALRALREDPNPVDMRSTLLGVMALARHDGSLKPKLKQVLDQLAKKEMPKTSLQLVKRVSRMLSKAEPKGGMYHRRVPRPGGGYRYYYNKDSYNRSKDAHHSGDDARAQAMSADVTKATTTAGHEGCDVKAMKRLAKKYGKAELASHLKKQCASGKIVYKGKRFYLGKGK